MSSLKAHKFAEFLPEMTADEFAALKDSIEANGLLEAVVLFEGKILDGRHRQRACDELGKPIKTTEFRGSEGDAVAFVYNKSIHRSMTLGQKACASVLMLPFFEKAAFSRMKQGCSANGAPGGKSAKFAAQLYHVSPRLVEMGKQLLITDKDRFSDALAGKKTIHAALQACSKARRNKQVRTLKTLPLDEKTCTLLEGDVIECLEQIAANSVRCIFTDPPYNLGKKYHGDKTGDALLDNDFIGWCVKWLFECYRVLTPDGSIFVMMNGRHAPRLHGAMRSAGLHWRNTVYWWENNPENQKGNFSDAVRPIHYFTKSPEEFVFNDAVRVPSRRNEIGDKRGIDSGKLPDNVWIEGRIPGNAIERVPFEDAPPQLPVSIPQTCILVSSEAGDTVLDPFNGNGTTGIAALRNGRKYVGIDQSKKYLGQSRKWIAAQLAKKE